MNVNENVIISGEGGKSFPSTSSSFILELDDNMTKGEFVDVLKEIDDSEMLGEFLKAQRRYIHGANQALSSCRSRNPLQPRSTGFPLVLKIPRNLPEQDPPSPRGASP